MQSRVYEQMNNNNEIIRWSRQWTFQIPMFQIYILFFILNQLLYLLDQLTS